MKKSTEQLVICPWCGYHANRASEVHDDGSAPKDGDFSLCITCGKWSVFEAKLAAGLRKPNFGETLEIGDDVECFKAWVAWKLTTDRQGTLQ